MAARKLTIGAFASEAAQIQAPTWFMAPSAVFENASIRDNISNADFRLYMFLLYNNSLYGPEPLYKSTIAERSGISLKDVSSSMERLVGWCLASYCGNEDDGKYSLIFGGERQGALSQEEPKAEKQSKEKKSQFSFSGAWYKEITDTVKSLAVASGVRDDIMGGVFWQAWVRTIKAWDKKMESDPDEKARIIIKALYAFYNDGYDFESPHIMQNKISSVLNGTGKRIKYGKRKLIQNPHDLAETEWEAEDITWDGTEDLTLENRYCRA